MRHIEAIHKKLGVHSRRELVAALSDAGYGAAIAHDREKATIPASAATKSTHSVRTASRGKK